MNYTKEIEIEINVTADDSGMIWPCCGREWEFDEGYGDLPWAERYATVKCECGTQYEVENTPHWSLVSTKKEERYV